MGEPRKTGSDGKAPEPGRAPHANGPAFWEWVVAGLGLILFVATLGYLVYDALARRPAAASPEIRVSAVERQGSRFLVRLRVRNAGNATAAGLRISGVLRRDGQVVERSEMELEHLPGESSREGGLFFTHDPSRLDLELRAEGFHKP